MKGIVVIELLLGVEVLDMLWYIGMVNVSVVMVRVGVRRGWLLLGRRKVLRRVEFL